MKNCWKQCLRPWEWTNSLEVSPTYYWFWSSLPCLSSTLSLPKLQCDKFTVEAVDIGKPFKVKVRHDNSGLNASWFLDRIEVLDDEGEAYPFHCERWIGKSKDDGKLQRSLYVKVRVSANIELFANEMLPDE